MDTQLASLFFSITIFSLSLIEKRKINNIITPFNVIAWPFIIISLLANFVLIQFKFPAITIRVHFFILINLIVIWIVGMLMYYLKYRHKKIEKNRGFDFNFEYLKKYENYFIVLSWIIIFLTLSRAHALLNQHGGWAFFGDQLYEDTMIRGWIAHLAQLGKVFFLLLLFLYKYSNKKFLIILTLTGLIVAMAALQVKYNIMWLIVMAFFFKNFNYSPKKQIKNLIKMGMILFAVMSIFLIGLKVAWGTFGFSRLSTWEYVFGQFFNYLASPPMVLEKWLTLGDIKPEWTLLVVFKNIYKIIIGDPHILVAKTYISHGFFTTAPNFISNVGTAFGVYYFIGGVFFSIFMSALISLLSYLFYFKSILTKKPVMVYMNLLFLTTGLLTFFGQYITQLTTYEMTVLFIIVIIITNFIEFIKKLDYKIE